MTMFWRLFKKTPQLKRIEKRVPIIPFHDANVVTEYRLILEGFLEVFDRHKGFEGEVAYVKHLLALLEMGSIDLAVELSGKNVWGAMGSLEDALFELNVTENKDQARADDRKMDYLFSQLGRRLINDGLIDDRLVSIIEDFHRNQ